jgi:hypothetical protein
MIANDADAHVGGKGVLDGKDCKSRGREMREIEGGAALP